MSKFKDAVVKVVRMIPPGKVVSYGQVALYIGLPRAARQVGWIMNGLDPKSPTPWWRVVNNEGRVSIKNSRFTAQEQAELLRGEGIDVRTDLSFDIEKYIFLPDKDFIEKLELDPIYLAMVSDKIPYTKPRFKGK